MKKTVITNIRLLLIGLLVATACDYDFDSDYITINGKVEREINGDGVPNHKVTAMTRKNIGSGLFATTKELDRKQVITDESGNFSVSLVNEQDAFVTIYHNGGDNYSGSRIYRDYSINKPILLKVNKLIKFKILVNNHNPINENDYISIDFFAGRSLAENAGIENFGTINTHYPEEQLPYGGAISAYEETSWTGINVNSIVYYIVPETAETFKIKWRMTKNGIKTDGFTSEIPYNIDEENSYTFEY
jgi:hypothetical protein